MTVFGIEIRWIAAAAAVCGLLLWDICWALRMAPKKGTLEWIARTDPPPMALPGISRIRGARWALIPAAFLLGAAIAVCREGIPAATPDGLLPLGLSAVGAAIFSAALLHSGGSALSVLLGTLLFSACGTPDPADLALLVLLWLLTLACLTKSRVLCGLSLLGAVAAALLSRTAWTGSGLLLLPVEYSIPDALPLCAALAVLTALPLLIAAARLHSCRMLCLGLLALVCLPAALFGMELLSFAGALAALACMMTAAEERGAKFSPVLLFCLLFACIFVTIRRM